VAVNINVWLNPVSAWHGVAETTTKSVRQMQIDGDWGTPYVLTVIGGLIYGKCK
jgi:hypothetical protein